MKLGISFSVFSLFYSIFLVTVFYSKKHIKSTETNIYSMILVTNLFGLIVGLLNYAVISLSDSYNLLKIFTSKL